MAIQPLPQIILLATGYEFQVKINDIVPGMYAVKLLSENGQTILVAQWQYEGGYTTKAIRPSAKSPAGTYLIIITANNGFTKKLIAQVQHK